MFKSFHDDEFEEAISKKEFMKLKSFTVSAIQNNPSFCPMEKQKISEAEIVVKTLEKEVPEIFEEYEIQDGERPFDPKDEELWDREYFIRQTSLLKMRNFSKTRIDNIRKIGQKISKDSKESQNANFLKPQEQKITSSKASQNQQMEKRHNFAPMPILLVGGILLILIVLVVIMLKK